MTDLAIEVKNLNYTYPTGSIGLQDISLSLAWGSRLVIVGPNGAGKSTLLKLVSGQRLTSTPQAIKLAGQDPFSRASNNVATFLGTEWILNSVIRRDMPVKTLIESVGINNLPDRRDVLLEILDIDLSWNMNHISDGQRRRVQLLIKLFPLWQVLLLDEVTVDLDVLVRLRLLNWLKQETLTRKSCIIYATHIFDGLATLDFPTHLIHLNKGKITKSINFNDDIEFVAAGQGTEDESEVKYNDIEQILRGKSDGNKTIEDQHTRKKMKICMVPSVHPLALHWLSEDYKSSKQ
ncbi:putative ATP-binding cassette family ATPase [Saccharomycopsis crataegensis]|uniref:ATP-binding cassette family ATPase n=1 Tax=Saccharomycopsis crataegensis TaxID=43959 RepID=A0AAV5QHZ9_9ASCO|nr:putative ATP-binding cassette family ATPase [Saccharomycopsis crataegensis]